MIQRSSWSKTIFLGMISFGWIFQYPAFGIGVNFFTDSEGTCTKFFKEPSYEPGMTIPRGNFPIDQNNCMNDFKEWEVKNKQCFWKTSKFAFSIPKEAVTLSVLPNCEEFPVCCNQSKTSNLRDQNSCTLPSSSPREVETFFKSSVEPLTSLFLFTQEPDPIAKTEVEQLCNNYPLPFSFRNYHERQQLGRGAFKAVSLYESESPGENSIAGVKFTLSKSNTTSPEGQPQGPAESPMDLDSLRNQIDSLQLEKGSREVNQLSRLAFEARILKKLRDVPTLVKQLGIDCQFSDDFAAITHVMPLYNEGTLSSQNSKLTTRDRLQALFQVCQAMQGLHARSMAHRDIKPGNIFIKRDALGQTKAVLGDVGEVWDPQDQPTWFNQLGGTRTYWPPGYEFIESTSKKRENGLNLKQSRLLKQYRWHDNWALGQTVFESLTGTQIPPDFKEIKNSSEDPQVTHMRDQIKILKAVNDLSLKSQRQNEPITEKQKKSIMRFLSQALERNIEKSKPNQVTCTDLIER